jgi:hypothetical protein
MYGSPTRIDDRRNKAKITYLIKDLASLIESFSKTGLRFENQGMYK